MLKQRKTVRIRVLRGALIVGASRIQKGHTVEVDAQYADMLLSQFPNDYEIVNTKSKKSVEDTHGNVIQPSGSQAAIQEFGNVAVPIDGEHPGD